MASEHVKKERTHPPRFQFSLKGGHGNSMTINIGTSGNDKAQILVVTAKMCENSEFTPLQVCETIQAVLMEDYGGLHGYIKTNPEVPFMVRGHAIRERYAMLGSAVPKPAGLD